MPDTTAREQLIQRCMDAGLSRHWATRQVDAAIAEDRATHTADQPDPPRLDTQLDDALWDAITGGQKPTFVMQHERVCAVVAEVLHVRVTPLRAELERAERSAAEVRAAALTEAADAVATHTGNPIDANAQMLRRMAAAARPDDTTGAPAGCWCGHPEDRHYTDSTHMTFSDGCKDCRGWNGGHAYGRELPWAPDTDDTTGA